MKEIYHFCDRVTPNISGLVWISDSELETTTEYFEEINYLLDGLLIKDYKKSNKKIKTRFFLGKQYGKPFFVIYMKENEYDLKEIESHLNLAFQLNETNLDVLLIDKNQKMKNDITDLSKKFKKNSFISFH